MSGHVVVSLVGAPYDGAATLGWPGARYAPDEVRRHLAWMRMRVQDGHIYWVDQDRVVPWRPEQLVDAGDAAVVPHDLAATLAAVRAKTREEVVAGRVPAVVGGDDSILFPAVAGVHDAVAGSLGIVHLDAHLDLLDESPAQGRFSQSSGMRRALELPRVRPRHSVQVGTRSFNFPSSKRFIDEVGLTELPAMVVARRGLDWALGRVREVVAGVDHVFLSVDLDVLDPAHAPGVGWHEPGGLTSRELLDLIVANLIFQFAVAAAQRPG
jgi:agmatinase